MRLLGAQTEYTLRFRPAEGVARPGNQILYTAIREALERRVRAAPARGWFDRLRHRIWWENGGSLRYSFDPAGPEVGFVEAGTPECRGPRELLVYQKAQDRLLTLATADALVHLRDQGLAGELSLLKCGRDPAGRWSGAQETYEVEFATGGALLGWRVGMGLGILFALVAVAVQWTAWLAVRGFLAVVGVATLPLLLLWMVVKPVPVRAATASFEWLEGSLRSLDGWVATVTARPLVGWVSGLVRLFAYRRYQRPLLGFLTTRAMLTGAGTLHPDGSFGLSEASPTLNAVFRRTLGGSERGILETTHLTRPLVDLGRLRFEGLASLFRRRQRLVVGLSDANLCDVAEYLKLGTTSLVLDLAEEGRLADAPRLADPVGAVLVATDPSLKGWVALEGGGTMKVLELQRFYWQRATDWLADAEAPPLEAHRIVELWGRTLDALEHHPETLFGHLDWVTKLHLLSSAPDLSWAERKKIDLRYHELGTGYQRWLDEAGLCHPLVDEAEVVGACRRPPADTPAAARAARVREVAPELVEPVEVRAEPPAAVIDFAEARARRSRRP